MELLKKNMEQARIDVGRCEKVVSINQTVNNVVIQQLDEALQKMDQNSKQLFKLKHLTTAIRNGRIQIQQQMCLEDAFLEYEKSVKAVSKELQVSYGCMRAISDFIPKENWIKMQQANKFFYDIAVSRVQTKINVWREEGLPSSHITMVRGYVATKGTRLCLINI